MLIARHQQPPRQQLQRVQLQQQLQRVQLQQLLPQRQSVQLRHQRKIQMAVLELWLILTFDQIVSLIVTMI